MEDPMRKLGGIFSPELLVRVLSWKYVYHISANRIRKMLKNQGTHLSKGTLNRYIQNGMSEIRQFLSDVFKREVQSTNYMMVDETTELVGIDEDNELIRRNICVHSLPNLREWFTISMIMAAVLAVLHWIFLRNSADTYQPTAMLPTTFSMMPESIYAALNVAFMFSVTESCTLNDINPENYLSKILTIIKDEKDVDKIQLLPCYYCQ